MTERRSSDSSLLAELVLAAVILACWFLFGYCAGIGAAAPQAVRTWGCTAVLPGAHALPSDGRLVAIAGGERSEPSPPAQAVPSWETEPIETTVTWSQEAPDLTGYTWVALSPDGEIPLTPTCEIRIDPGTGPLDPPPPDEPPPPVAGPVAPSRLRIQPVPRQEPGAPMSLTFDAATDGVQNASYSHTTSGTDRLLMVAVRTSGSAGPASVTYDGIAMTQAAWRDGMTGDGSADSGIFLLLNPPLGAHTVSVTINGGTLSGSVALSWTGADQSTQPEALFSKTINVNDDTSSIVTTTPGAAVIVANCTYYYNYNGGVVVDAPYTNRITAARHWKIGDTGPVSPGTQTVVSHGPGFSYSRHEYLIAITPSAGAGSPGNPAYAYQQQQ
jgi:hypothetical protein